MFDINGLNPEQKKAAMHVDGPVLILAGAGSGKTRTVTFRIAHMIENCKIPAHEILAVSFTNKAAKEMKQRVKKLLSARKIKGITLSTFHALGIQILKQEIHHLGYSKQFTIFDVGDQMSVLREVMKQYKASKNFQLKTLQSKISHLKNMGLTLENYVEGINFDESDEYDLAIEYAFPRYQEKLQYFNAVDFDDILSLTLRLFDEFPEIARKYSRRFKFITIDEYQDTNDLQYKLIRHLTSTHSNLCVVGDDDQAIYAFRGANIQNILNFEKHFSQAKVVKLEQNYRSTMPILKLANNIISQNTKRKDKKMWSQTPSDIKPHLWATADTDHEAMVICEEINKLQNQGILLHDMSILYRSNTQVPVLEDQLRIYRIPYKILGGQKLFDKKEVKDVIAYLSLIVNPANEIALRRVLNVPTRGIGMTSLKQALTIAANKKTTLYKTIKQVDILEHKRALQFHGFIHIIDKYRDEFFSETPRKMREIIKSLLDEIKFDDYIVKSYDGVDKIVNIKRNDIEYFLDSADRFESHFGKEANLVSFLDKMMLTDSQDDKDEEGSQITLMTFHASKGLEFNTVFMVGVEEELLPHKRTIQMGDDIEEECRLAYVGITRAQKRLYMTYTKGRVFHNKDIPRHVSRFIYKADPTLYLKEDKTTFDSMSDEEEAAYKDNFLSNMMDMLED